ARVYKYPGDTCRSGMQLSGMQRLWTHSHAPHGIPRSVHTESIPGRDADTSSGNKSLATRRPDRTLRAHTPCLMAGHFSPPLYSRREKGLVNRRSR
ncbi:hypothetical protein JYU34_000807, partial [Plutella xylostella]